MKDRFIEERLRAARAGQASAPTAKPQPRLQSQYQPQFAAIGQTKSENAFLGNGFTEEESRFLHQAIRAAGLNWFDGEGVILGKKDTIDLVFKAGGSEFNRWAVMSFPIIHMDHESSVETCLHFLTEAYYMAHALDFQYQVAINPEREQLEFLVQIPIKGVEAVQLGNLIAEFLSSLHESVQQELKTIFNLIAKDRGALG